MNARGVAHIEQESDHDGLVAVARKELDLLVPALILDAEIMGVEIRYETPAIVSHADRHDDLVDLYLDRRRLGLAGTGLRGWSLSESEAGKKDGDDSTTRHLTPFYTEFNRK